MVIKRKPPQLPAEAYQTPYLKYFYNRLEETAAGSLRCSVSVGAASAIERAINIPIRTSVTKTNNCRMRAEILIFDIPFVAIVPAFSCQSKVGAFA